MAQGKLIAFEGIDGSGITTQAELLRGWFQKSGMECYLTKEPTAGPAGAVIGLVLSRRLVVDPIPLALFFAADRMDHVITDILPKLELGINVISDRYYLSSLAYQSLEVDIAWVKEINSRCQSPDITILIDAPAEICGKRMQRQRWHVELYEEVAKLEQVRLRYREIAQQLADEGQRIVKVDGAHPVNDVRREVLGHVRRLLSRPKKSSPIQQLGFAVSEAEPEFGD